jgi:hypothetical protein
MTIGPPPKFHGTRDILGANATRIATGVGQNHTVRATEL